MKSLINKICCKCKTPLVEGNHYPSNIKNGDYICKDCWNKHCPTDTTEWSRRHEICLSNGKRLVGDKRPYPIDGKCELCERTQKFLAYHHWNDENLMQGVWVCNPCHSFIEIYEKVVNIVSKWINLKLRITNEN